MKKLHAMTAFLKGIVDDKLTPKLEHYRRQAPKHFHGVKNDDLMGDLLGDFEGIRAFFYKTYTDKAILKMAESIGFDVADLNALDIKSQFKQVLGVDIFLDDSKLADRISAFSFDNTRLIETIPERYLNDVQSKVFDGFSEGLSYEEIASDLKDRYGVSKWNAERIARDQVNKLNGQLTEERQTDLGVSQYIWRTALDDRVRPEHEALEGQTFDWDGANESPAGYPGSEILCRCWAEPVLGDLI